MARRPLSFSINPLLGGPSLNARTKSGSPYRELMVSDVDVDPEQPRKYFDEQSLNELSESIKEHGLLSPILVKPNEGGTFKIVAGERRFRAAKMAGLETIPALIDRGDESQDSTLLRQLVENMQRNDLNAVEKSEAISKLKDSFQLSIRDIAKSLGVSKSNVQRLLEVGSLSEDLKQAIIFGASESKVLIIAGVEDIDKRRELLSKIDEYSREELVEMINRGFNSEELSVNPTQNKSKRDSKSKHLSVEDRRIIEDLRKYLGTKVLLNRSKSKPEAGKLVIDFYNTEDLREVYRRLISDS